MATRSLRPPLKHTPFTELLPTGEQFVSNPWYDWALNIARYVGELEDRLIVIEDDIDDNEVNINDLLTADVGVFAPQMWPTATDGCDSLVAFEFATTQPNFVALPFQPGVDTSADFNVMLPFFWAGKQFSVWVYWGHADGGTAWDVLWEIDANSTFDNEPLILDFIGGIGVVDSGGTPGNLYIARSGLVPIASYENQEGSLVSVRIARRGLQPEDTMDIPAYLLAVRFILDETLIVAPTYATASFLLHLDGDFADSSANNMTPTVTGGADTSAMEQKFGAESLTRFATAASDKVTYANHADLGFGTDRVFSVDFWIYVSSSMSVSVGHNFMFGKWGSGTQNCWAVEMGFSQQLYWVHSGNGSTYTFRQITSTLSTDTWHHIAIWKTSDKKLHSAVDGVIDIEYVGTSGQNEIFSGTETLLIGTTPLSGPFAAPWPANLFVDELRICVDTIDYDATDFTPPTSAYT